MKKPKTKKQSKKKSTATPATKKSVSTKSKLGTPYGDRVLVKPVPQDTVTSFGIIIPDTAKEKPEQGIVVAVGVGKRSEGGALVPLQIRVGDKIMFNKYGYDEVTIHGTEYYLIREDSITYVF